MPKEIKKETYYTIILHSPSREYVFVNLKREDFNYSKESGEFTIGKFDFISKLDYSIIIQVKKIPKQSGGVKFKYFSSDHAYFSDEPDNYNLELINQVKKEINLTQKELYDYLKPKGNKREQHIKKLSTELNNGIKKMYAFIDALI